MIGAFKPVDTLIILPVGDSITQGGKKDRKEYTYRLPLQMILNQHGINYDFIGSQQEGLHDDFDWPDIQDNVPFDPDHLNFNGGGPAMQIREVVEQVATDLHTPESPVITEHHYENWHENPEHTYSDTYDWAHPNLKGQEKMAMKWFESMRPFLQK